jgi:L-ascorbate metabolism protein UlaG (beta-lactamase superfamily)
MIEGIHWIGHASFRIEDEVVIYLDPWKLKQFKAADLILVTHGHRDHLSPEDIARIRKPDTVIVIAAPYADQVEGDVRPMMAGQTVTVGDVVIEAVPSYNTNKPNHPRSAGNVGYIVEVGGRRIYHAGDSDLIPEMNAFRCDVALLPMGGKYTMDVDEALEAVARIRPKVVIPMHWGDIVGAPADAERFRTGAPAGVEVVILTPEG